MLLLLLVKDQKNMSEKFPRELVCWTSGYYVTILKFKPFKNQKRKKKWHEKFFALDEVSLDKKEIWD